MAWILIIEDDLRMRSIIHDALALVGYDVLAVATGREGLAHVRSHPVDLIVTDLFMPDMDGLEIIRELRRARPELPILAISGGSQQILQDFLPIAARLGAGRTLQKPFTLEVLYTAVEELLQRAESVDP